MNDRQLLRYSRHILLDALGIEAQERLLASRVLVVGAGGLGSPAALYLAAAGVGTLVLADGDTVEASNLQRQILHTQQHLGKAKAESGIQTLARINPEIRLVALARRLAGAELEAEVAAADVVLDCSDNFATRHAINRACVRHARPLVSGAAIGFSGQVSVFDLARPASPCYHCLFPDGEEDEALRCAVTGVFAPLTGMVGSIQAGEAIKCLTGAGTLLSGRLLLVDALDQHWRTLTFTRDPACPVCGHRPLPAAP
jgi:adenylyltransferase/sulfurtransferase